MLNKGNDGLTAREEQQNYKGSPEISVDSDAGAVPHGQRVLAAEGPEGCTLLLSSRFCDSQDNYHVRRKK